MKAFVTPEKTKYHAMLLANRVKKMYAHFRKRFVRRNIDCYRLYDWDIPEVRAVVDYYKGHIVVGEYVRKQTSPQWLPIMAEAVGEVLSIPKENIHIKKRRTSTKEEPRYERMDKKEQRFVVNERDLKFWVNLNDFLDTGLYSDHRETRVIISKLAKDKNFLNLYCYSGAFTCAAAYGGAKKTVSVDRSETYLKWANDNIKLNGLMGTKNYLIKSDVFAYLKSAQREGTKFTLAVVDPPSFFRFKSSGKTFDINEDHPILIKEVIKVMEAGSAVFFSTNHQRFEPRMSDFNVSELRELTPKTIPEDYRNKRVHRCWKIIV